MIDTIIDSSDPAVSWESIAVTGRTPSPRHAHTSTLVGTQLYVFGGYGVGGVHLGDLYCFDLLTNKWSKLKVPQKGGPSPRHSHTAVAHGGSLWIFGGIGNGFDNNVFNDLYRYDIAQETWEQIEHNGPVVPSPRWGHTAVLNEPTNEMFVFGGMNEVSFFNHVLVFNFITRQWNLLVVKDTTLNPPPHGRQYHNSVIIKGCLYIFGGYDGVVCPVDMLQLNLETLVWRGVSGKHIIRRGAVTVSYEGDIYMFGGRQKNISDSLHVFKTDTLTWKEIPLTNRPSKRQFSAGIVYDGWLYIFGGQGDYNENDIYRYRLSNRGDQSKSRHHFENLVDNTLFSDIKFQVEGKIIHAHKCILVSRSDHFKAMIMNGMKESTQDCINISDTSYEVFKSILYYLYTNHIVFKNVNILELLSVADRYIIKDIKEECTKYLINSLNESNLEEIRSLMDTYSLPELRPRLNSLDLSIQYRKSNK